MLDFKYTVIALCIIILIYGMVLVHAGNYTGRTVTVGLDVFGVGFLLLILFVCIGYELIYKR